MHTISAAYKAAISAGYKIATECDIVKSGLILNKLPLLGGTVTISRSGSTRATCSLTASVDDTSWMVPNSLNQGVITPYGNELVLKVGVTYPSGATELVQVGVFVIADVELTDLGSDVQMTITGMDRGWLVGTRKFLAPHTVTAGTALDTAIKALITTVYADAQFSIPPTSATVPADVTYAEGDDPWNAAQTLATAAGYELYFNNYGVVVAYPIPDPTTQATSWTYSEGSGGTIKQLYRKLTRQGVSNYFVASSSSSNVSPPVRAVAADTDPTSPTYDGGVFGIVPSFDSSSIITTAADATAAATKDLAAAKGNLETLKLTAVLNPAHQVDDVIAVNRSRMGISGRYVVDTVSLVLGHGGSTTLECRRAM